MMAPRPMYEVTTNVVNNYFVEIGKKRALTENEKQLRNLSLIAKELKVDKFSSFSKDPALLEVQNIYPSMSKKIQENPQWDVALSVKSLKYISSHDDLLKNTFGQKSYEWAWILKQRGEKAEAKKILLEVFEEGFQNVMRMSTLRFDNSSPLSELQFVQKALDSMVDSKEEEMLDSKMQKMKNHFSNLPSSNIKT